MASASSPAARPEAAPDPDALRGEDGVDVGEIEIEADAKPPVREGLEGGRALLEASFYPDAERELDKVAKEGKTPGDKLTAKALLARLYLETGRLELAVRTAREVSTSDKARAAEIAPVAIRALARQGKLDLAIQAGEAVKGEPSSRSARLALGEVLQKAGRDADATDVLMTIVEDFNQRRVTIRDGEGMAQVARASMLLRSKRDANESYDDAERAGYQTPELFLERAELFLSAYNYARAEQMVREAKKRAPHLAAAWMMDARVRLAQTLDFDAAERAVKKALEIDPARADADFVRAGIALRDMELETAEEHVAAGLTKDPKDLELLSMKAAVRFLSDDRPGFDRAIRDVFAQAPRFAEAYLIVGEYADWEHRYAEIVDMMTKAISIDPSDGRLYVALGINQIRIGREKDGVQSLDKGFRKDKFNVRAFNTLNLYERDIPEKYVDATHGPFRLRYPKDEAPMLERYIPGFLDEAWKDMRGRYEMTPTTPIAVELYATREHFAVRTSGLPNIGIQGVCFGETLAAMSPGSETFNWGMVLWHELAHVFAIQRSKNHVPRWFTEGLSEWETLARRPEWRREEDPSLYLALRRGKIPSLADMNRAFTHAEDLRDVGMAYYASSQIAVFLEETRGMKRVTAMLAAWGQGQRTPEVLSRVLGATPEALDAEFRAWLAKRLVRYDAQFVPDLRAKDLDVVKAALEKSPDDPGALVDAATIALAQRDTKAALALLEKAIAKAPGDPRARYLRARLTTKKDPASAEKDLDAILAAGKDGYAVRLALGDAAQKRDDLAKARAQYEAAARLDPTQSEPAQALADLARKTKDDELELASLRRLILLDQHDPRPYRRLMAKLLARSQFDEAVKVGEAALYVDLLGAETHTLYAEACFGKGDVDKAIFEADSALLGRKKTAKLAARASVVLAKAWAKKGDSAKAKAARDEALRQDPESADAKSLP